VHANLKSGEGVSEVLTGVDRALIFAPPGYVPQNEILSPLIQAAARNSLERVRLLTALGANAVDTALLRIAEFELERSAKKGKTGSNARNRAHDQNVLSQQWVPHVFQANFFRGDERQFHASLIPV
jgi:hypothetical protein